MKRLSKKLHSERGASILMALLMFLVCCMVAASILAAAASNAGKYRSNRVEQQKYLVLSSAIRLIADEIQKAEYTGKYQVYEWTVTTTTVTTNADGTTSTATESKYYFHIQQTAGTYSCGDITDQLPLGKELDEIFSGQFTGAGYTPLNGNAIEAAAPRTLTVTLNGLPDETGPNIYKVGNTVTVQVELNHSTRHITLTAWLGDGTAPASGQDTMIAELVAKAVPSINYNPAGRTAGNLPIPSSSGPTQSGTNTTVTTTVTKTKNGNAASVGTPMKWELHWIRKGAAS